MKNVTIMTPTAFGKQAGQYVKQVRFSHEAILLGPRQHPEAAVVPMEVYEWWLQAQDSKREVFRQIARDVVSDNKEAIKALE